MYIILLKTTFLYPIMYILSFYEREKKSQMYIQHFILRYKEKSLNQIL